MIAAATSEERPYDIILVHSPSRLVRSATQFMQYRAMLKRAKVQIVSTTQSFDDDPASNLAFCMLELFDDHARLETARYIRRAKLAKKTARVLRVRAFVLEAYRGDHADAEMFLPRAHPALGGDTPLQRAIRSDQGAEQVIQLVGRARYGGGF